MTSKSKSEKWLLDYLLLSLVLLLYGINIYYLTSLDFEPPKWDESVHLRDSLVFYNVLSDPFQINLEIIKEIINKSEQYPLLRPSGYYPPFAPILTSILYLMFGTSSKVAVMSNIIFLIILNLSVYEIGKYLFNRNVGLLACFIILLYPIVLTNSVIYMLDLPLMAMVALGISILLKTNCFNDTKFSIFSGIALGLGMLTKWTYIFFVIGPICYLILKVYREGNSGEGSERIINSSKPIWNIFIFLVASILTFGPYYFPILPSLIEETFRYTKGVLVHSPVSLFSFASVSFYPVALWKDMITPFGFIVLTIGILIISFSKNRYKAFLFLWLIIPYLVFTFVIQNKQPRYMMPLLVPISLIISYAISEFEIPNGIAISTKLKKYTISLSLIIFIIFFIREDLRLRNSIISSSKVDWKITEIVSVLEQDVSEYNSSNQSYKIPKYLGVIPDHHFINGQTIRYYTTLKLLPINVIKLQNYRGTALEEFVEKFDRYDYILTKNISNVAITSYQKSIDDMHNFFYSNINQFENLLTINETDGSQISIYKRKKPPIEKNNES